MINKPNNPPAFPMNFGHSDMTENPRGMSLLDYFAGQAMQGKLAGGAYSITLGQKEKLAEESYLIAKAMLSEREKHL